MSKARTSLKYKQTDYETSEHNPNTIHITLVQNPPQLPKCLFCELISEVVPCIGLLVCKCPAVKILSLKLKV